MNFGSILSGTLGAIGNTALGLFTSNQQNVAQAGMLNQQENYQTNMSDTAYQRATADMKAAGLNPGSMYGTGGPATTPMGTAGVAAGASPGNFGDLTNTAQQLGIQKATADAQIKATNANTVKTVADTQKTLADTRSSNAAAKLAEQQLPGKVDVSNMATQAASSAKGVWDWLKSGGLGAALGDVIYGGQPSTFKRVPTDNPAAADGGF